MNNKDYIPESDGKFLEWAKFLFANVKEHATAWNLTAASWAKITPLLKTYETAYTKAQDPNRGKADVLEKNEARDVLKKAVRQYVKEYLTNNHLITDDDRERIGLPVHDTKPTPAPPVTDMPVGEVDFSTRMRHSLHVKMGKLTGKAKPGHVNGFEVWSKIGGDPPTDDSQWSYAGFSSRSPMTIDYPQSDTGKTVYYRFRWVNTRNQPGPWSEGIVSAIIP
jgi:hypothetical protein